MKGISTIISTVLLLAVGITLVSLYSSWAPELSEDLTRETVDQTNQETKCRNAGLALKNPVYHDSANATTFELINTGSIRFVESIEIAAINSSVINSTSVQGLEVEASISDRVYSSEKPERLIVSSSDCPSIQVGRTEIASN